MKVQNFLSSTDRILTPRARRLAEAAALALRLRHRHIYTRHGALRFRVTIAPVMAVLLALPSLLSLSVDSLGQFSQDRFEIAAADSAAYDNENIEKQYELASKRLQRYAARKGVVLEHQDKATASSVLKIGPPRPREEAVTIGKGDTLAELLNDAGLTGAETQEAVAALKDHYNPRDMKPGQTIKMRFDPESRGRGEGSGRYRLASLSVDVSPLKTVSLIRGRGGDFRADVDERQPVKRMAAAHAMVENSLYGSALKAGIPSTIVAEAIRVFSWDVDFQRDIRRGDSLQVMFESLETEGGRKVGHGDIVYARLEVGGRAVPLYRYMDRDGNADFYTADGASIRKSLLTTPIDGARMSSGFGMRRHPILGYNKMHKGVDFAAPTGTPIFAAGDGTVEKASRFSAYGNYVRIRHRNGISTAYAHLSKYGKGIRPGIRVKQGQVIGYVGSTGRSTGPHLHYEVLVNGAQVNPRGVKMQQGNVLKGQELAAFRDHVRTINRQFDRLMGGGEVAAAPARSSGTKVR